MYQTSKNCFFSILLFATVFLFSFGYFAEAQTTGSRTISFPEGKPIGRILIRDSNTDSYEWWQGQYSPDWIPAGNASGNISIPEGKESVLLINSKDVPDLSPLGKLKPDDIDFLIIRCERKSTNKPNDESLQYICHLTGLKTLILEQTDITNEGLKSLAKLPSLIRLRFSSEMLDDSGLANIAEIKSLKGLRFYSNKVTNKGISYLAKLSLLEEFFPDTSNIDADCLVHISKMPRLEHILLTRNKLCDKKIINLKDSSSLKKLEFLDPQLSDEWLENLGKLSQVEELVIQNTSLSDEYFKHLKSMSSLKKIRLQQDFGQTSSALTDTSLLYMSEMDSLESIELYYGEFTDKGLEYLSKLKNLQTLVIPNSHNFTGSGIQYLTKLENLEHLNIGSRRLKDDDLEPIGRLKNLKELMLFNSRDITNAGISKLSGLNSLESLEIWAPKVTTTGLNHLNALSNLNLLEVQGGYADDIGPDDTILNIKYLSNLNKLRIPVFRNEDLDCIVKLSNLRQLEIDNQGIVTNEGLARLKNLTSLNILSFTNTYTTDDGLKNITDFNKLSQLTISGDITEQGLSYLEKLENLTYLHIITPNSIDPEAIQNLIDVLPNHPQINIEIRTLPELPSKKIKVGQRLPLEDIDINFSLEELEGKKILLCLWDMEQRPSRNCITQLSQKADELKEKNVNVIAVHTSEIDQATLNDWMKEYNIPFLTGTLKSKPSSESIIESKIIPNNWETESLPRLILTDSKHNISNLDFSPNDLDEITN